jgi:hypothetical protein
MASSPNMLEQFYLNLTFFAALAFPSALVDNIFVHSNGFFRTLTIYSLFFQLVRRQTRCTLDSATDIF